MLFPPTRYPQVALLVLVNSGRLGSARDEARPPRQAWSAAGSSLAQLRAELSKALAPSDGVSSPRAEIQEEQATTGGSFLSYALPAAAALVLGTVLASSILRPYLAGEAEGPVCAALAGVMAHHMEGIVFTYILSDSLALSHRLGMDARFSGLLLGAHKVGTASGSFAMWCAMQRDGSFWRRGRPLFRCAVATQCAGALAFAVAAGELGFHSHSSVSAMLLFSRFVAGFGGGLLIFLTLTLIGRIIAPEARRAWNVWFFLAGVSGLGTGPLCAAAVRQVQMLFGIPLEHLIRSSLVVLPFLPMAQLPSVVCYPDLQGATDLSARSDSFKASNVFTQSLLVVICVAMQVIRNLTISSLEAGTTMMLETDHHWGSVPTGLTIAVVVGSVIFASFAYKAIADSMSAYAQQHAMNFLMLVGASLICVCRGPWLLLLGVTIAFAASAISGGLIIATLQQHVLPKDYVFDLNRSMLLAVVGADLVGRGGGPVLARTMVMWGGQTLFATVQIILGVSIVLLHEVAHHLSATRDSREDGSHSESLSRSS